MLDSEPAVTRVPAPVVGGGCLLHGGGGSDPGGGGGGSDSGGGCKYVLGWGRGGWSWG